VTGSRLVPPLKTTVPIVHLSRSELELLAGRSSPTARRAPGRLQRPPSRSSASASVFLTLFAVPVLRARAAGSDIRPWSRPEVRAPPRKRHRSPKLRVNMRLNRAVDVRPACRPSPPRDLVQHVVDVEPRAGIAVEIWPSMFRTLALAIVDAERLIPRTCRRSGIDGMPIAPFSRNSRTWSNDHDRAVLFASSVEAPMCGGATAGSP